MNILKLIESFTNEGVIKSLGEKQSRRDSFAQFGKIGANAAMAALPLSLLFSNKASAQTSNATTATSALQLALTLEYLEDEFYAMALDSAGLVPSADQAIIAQIGQHEADHVAFLQSALGAAAPSKPTFDFTLGGQIDPFNDYPTFLAVAQAFEDTGVRAYKGQAGNLMSNGDLLTAALQIHSVEARHASQIRRLRGQKGWITGNSRGDLPGFTQPVYDGEENTIHGGANITGLMATNGPALTNAGATESFDEILTGEQATNIAGLFIV
jgi:Ferritin-like domain